MSKKTVIKKFNKILVANRGEISIRIFRACSELLINTLAIYSEEDSLSLHRNKADEAYLIGKNKGPVEAYLDIDGIIELAKDKNVDAIHPGYGFLSENAGFARACEDAGISFIGPCPESIAMMGDKVEGRKIARKAGVPVVPGTESFVKTQKQALEFIKSCGYPVMVKAAMGGGGRGIRICRDKKSLIENFKQSKSEAKAAFGDDSVLLEKYIENPKHIEVQILGDKHGKVIHLFERDCSVQRRFQKVVEIAPSLNLSSELKAKIYHSAVKIAREANYFSAGTIEFLIERNNYYFIEMNTRIQVEHTVTEMVTGVDLIQAQIRIAEGYKLSDKELFIPKNLKLNGYAMQCRITTEDPTNNFQPDIGRLTAYRSSGGFGVRLDAASAYVGAVITPYYDSMLVKMTTWGNSFEQCILKMDRSLREFRIRGVKTNIPFLLNVIRHEIFKNGKCTTTFLDNNKELFEIKESKDRATKLLRFISDTNINTSITKPEKWKESPPVLPRVPECDKTLKELKPEHREVLDKKGPEALSKWILEQKKLLITDTTFRDAHQSLLATRMRSYDILNIAEATSYLEKDVFSFEMWGGATFDVCMRFLKESPWDRLERIRNKMPNSILQMLLRGSNAVGYKNYPDNVVKEFIDLAAQNGIDLFRIFDCFNWIPNMKVSIEQALKTGKIVEPAICYTGDITDPNKTKYTLDYYINLAKEFASMGVHIIAIKDMAGLCKPFAAELLVKAIKEETGLPVHFHTHATSGNAEATILKAAEAGVDIVDGAISSLSGLTSQPSLNAIVAAMENSPRDTGIDVKGLHKLASYWEDVRELYSPFEGDMKSSNADVYLYEIPGGQYTNLRAQAKSLGLAERWEEVKQMYAEVNMLFGDIIKVTPSSKVVGDLALFLVQNNLSTDDVLEQGNKLSFPQSVLEMLMGQLGQSYGGFPESLVKKVLGGDKPLKVRPGESLKDEDFDKTRSYLKGKFKVEIDSKDIISYLLYPKVFEDYLEHRIEYDDTSVIPTKTFYYGMDPSEEISVVIEEGKTLLIKLFAVGEMESDGRIPILFELNGQSRPVRIKDKSAKVLHVVRQKADQSDENQIGAPLSGKIVKYHVKQGDKVKKEQPLFVIEAMKMQTNIKALKGGVVEKIVISGNNRVEAGDLVLRLS
ncbi:MAG: pyruvate carboxylase [Candidatus Dadabacteria bacterium]|nr:pyruvate carboxylase [Candidatus Dadabacteria bacterium]